MTSTGARHEILRRIGEALSHRGAGEDSVAAGVLGADASDRVSLGALRPTATRELLIKQFETELAAVGGVFHRVPNAAAACDCVVEIASTHTARSTIAWDVTLIGDLGLATILTDAGIEFFPGSAGVPPADFRVAATAADIGITTADYALADTGTLVLRSGAGRARSVSLLPPVHIALLKPNQIISGLDDLFPLLARDKESGAKAAGTAALPGSDSAVTFITGPSRTADIELTLVVGVHGPQELHVILLAES